MRQEILKLLERNSRLSAEQIALYLNLDPKLVHEEIAQMEAEKIILKYGAIIDWEKVGEEPVSALIEVKVVPQRDVGFDQVAARIYRFPEVKAAFLLSGTYDLSVTVEGKSLKEVARFVAEKLATLEHVQGTVTHFLLKKYKLDGVIFADEETDRRQVVIP